MCHTLNIHLIFFIFPVRVTWTNISVVELQHSKLLPVVECLFSQSIVLFCGNSCDNNAKLNEQNETIYEILREKMRRNKMRNENIQMNMIHSLSTHILLMLQHWDFIALFMFHWKRQKETIKCTTTINTFIFIFSYLLSSSPSSLSVMFFFLVLNCILEWKLKQNKKKL